MFTRPASRKIARWWDTVGWVTCSLAARSPTEIQQLTEPMARLVLLSEGYTGRTYELKGEKTTVGRVSDNAFEIPESSVSSHHAEIILQGNDVLVRDLG